MSKKNGVKTTPVKKTTKNLRIETHADVMGIGVFGDFPHNARQLSNTKQKFFIGNQHTGTSQMHGDLQHMGDDHIYDMSIEELKAMIGNKLIATNRQISEYDKMSNDLKQKGLFIQHAYNEVIAANQELHHKMSERQREHFEAKNESQHTGMWEAVHGFLKGGNTSTRGKVHTQDVQPNPYDQRIQNLYQTITSKGIGTPGTHHGPHVVPPTQQTGRHHDLPHNTIDVSNPSPNHNDHGDFWHFAKEFGIDFVHGLNKRNRKDIEDEAVKRHFANAANRTTNTSY